MEWKPQDLVFDPVDIQPIYTMGRQSGMQSVTITKNKLMEILTENRDKHLAAYKEAVIEYREAIRVLLSYDKALRMLKLSCKDEIELTTREFSEYVDDEWY